MDPKLLSSHLHLYLKAQTTLGRSGNVLGRAVISFIRFGYFFLIANDGPFFKNCVGSG